MRATWTTITARLVMGVGLGFLAGSAAQADVILLSGVLNSAQVVDGGGSTSTGTGFASLALDTGAQTLTLDFTWSGMSGPVDRAHLHDAPAGESRLVYDPFDLFFDEEFFFDNPLRTIDCPWSSFGTCVPASGTLHFTQDFTDIIDFSSSCDPTGEVCSIAQLVNMALNDIIYLDMHTELYPSGEIRGQLTPTAVPEPGVPLLLAWSLVFLAWHGRTRVAARKS